MSQPQGNSAAGRIVNEKFQFVHRDLILQCPPNKKLTFIALQNHMLVPTMYWQVARHATGWSLSVYLAAI
jgi:hypothetical protein